MEIWAAAQLIHDLDTYTEITVSYWPPEVVPPWPELPRIIPRGYQFEVVREFGPEPASADVVDFLFDESRVRPQLDEYIRGDALVEPLRFSAAVRALKRRTRELVG